MIEAVEKALGKRGRGLGCYSGTEHMCRFTLYGGRFYPRGDGKYSGQIAAVVKEKLN